MLQARLIPLFAFLFAILPGSIAAAQDGVGLLSDRVEETRAQANLVGLGAGLLIDGEIVAIAVDGNRVRGKDTPLSPEAVWHMGSITKSMTATLLAALAEDGVLSFDTTVGDIYGDEADASWRDITLHRLLTHRSGAPSNFGLISMLSPDPSNPEAISRQRQNKVLGIISKPLPGTEGEFVYSNVGFTIAGAMAEKITGKPWETLLTERVFAPLDITPTFGAPKWQTAPWGHATGLFGKAPKNPNGKADNPRFMGPAGTVALKLEDILHYGEAHLTQDPALLSRDSYDLLRTPPERDEETGRGYAYGWVVEPNGGSVGAGPMFWHNGSNTMWYALLIILPEADAVIAIVTNDGDLEAAEPAAFELAARIAEDYRLGH